MSTAEAAKALGVSVATLNRWAASGKLPVAHKVGTGRTGAHLYLREDVEALAAAEPSETAETAS